MNSETNNQNEIESSEYCIKGTDEEFEYYKRLVESGEDEDSISELKNIYSEEKELLANKPSGDVPTFIADFAYPMYILATMYMQRNEHEKALPLLEKALPLFRVLEITESDYSYQRYYAMEQMIECLHKLGNEPLALYYEYELLYLKSVLPKEHNK